MPARDRLRKPGPPRHPGASPLPHRLDQSTISEMARATSLAAALTVAALSLGAVVAPALADAKGRPRSTAQPVMDAPAAADDARPSTADASALCPTARPRLGPATAPVRVLLFLDPTSPGAYTTWLEARRIVGEYEGRVAVDLGVAQSHYGQAAATRDAQAFALVAMALQSERDPGPVLAWMARHGWRAAARRLAIAEDRAFLAEQLGLDPAMVETAWRERACLDRQVRQETERLFGWERAKLGGNTVPLPVAVTLVAGQEPTIKQEDARLDGMRLRLDAALTAYRHGPSTSPAPSGTVETRKIPTAPPPDPFRDEPELGMTLGAFGAPHHLAIFAESEVSTALSRALAAGLAHRSRHPGELSIHVVARGGSSRSIALRRRLCAARSVNLEMAYAEHLARPAETRPALPARALLNRLDAVAEMADCPPWEGPSGAMGDGDDGDLPSKALPRGVWLDGQVLQSADLPRLAARLRELGVGAAPWLWPGLTR